MTLASLIKTYGEGKGEKVMLAVTDMLSDFLKDNLSDDAYEKICKELYCKLAGGHFNKDFADIQIPQMYYEKGDEKKFAPYWTETEVKDIYDKVKTDIPGAYNFYDFEVTLNMIKSDYYGLVEKWFNDATEEQKQDRYIELAVNWLKDDDNPFGNEKVWKYFN